MTMTAITEQKKKLRKQMLFNRARLPKKEKAEYDRWICQYLWQIIDKNRYQTVHCYLPMGTEINIFPLIEILLEKQCTVVTPKTLPGRKLKNLVLQSLGELEKGVFGTMHPIGDEAFTGNYDLIIVPGLSFDANNYRLGYGGGYYDNFLQNHPSSRKVGIFYPFQEVHEVPLESHDVQLDEILVNKGFSGL